MGIIVIDGKSESAQLAFANTMRNSQIAQAKGALIVNEPGEDHPVVHQIEKILVGYSLTEQPVPKDLSTLPWKPEALVLVPAKLESALKEFDRVLPGFTRFFGPVKRVTTHE